MSSETNGTLASGGLVTEPAVFGHDDGCELIVPMDSLVRVTCAPIGHVGSVVVPGLGEFAPGEHRVAAAISAQLLASPHFRRYLAPNKAASGATAPES